MGTAYPNDAFGLNILELKTLFGFLDEATAEFEGHSCNDYCVPANDENKSVLIAAIEHSIALGINDGEGPGHPTEAEDHTFFIWDDWLMRYLASRCKSILETAASSPEIQGLSDAELKLAAGILLMLADNDFNLFEDEAGNEDFTLIAGGKHKEFLVAAISHAQRKGWKASTKKVMKSEDSAEAFAIDVMRWIAHRCVQSVGKPPSPPEPIGASVAHSTRLGLYKRWITEKTLSKNADESREKRGWKSAWAKNFVNMKLYGEGQNPYTGYGGKPEERPFASTIGYSFNKAWHYQSALIDNARVSKDPAVSWEEPFQKSVTYHYWWVITEFHNLCELNFKQSVLLLTELLTLGCMKEARELCDLISWCDVQGCYDKVDKTSFHCWILRICGEYWDLPFTDKIEKSALADLAEHWRLEDLSAHDDQLIWMCDYYTHRTGWKGEDYGEFTNSLHTRTPCIVLAWFRLRESLGLKNPIIDHPLMKPRHAQLPPAWSFYDDEVIQKMLARLRREELPCLGERPLSPPPQPMPTCTTSTSMADSKLSPQWVGGALAAFPSTWIDRSYPECSRFKDPSSGATISISEYALTDVSHVEWANISTSVFNDKHPNLKSNGSRTEHKGLNWVGCAEQFSPDSVSSSDPNHCLLICGKSKVSFFVFCVMAPAGHLFDKADWYVWLLKWRWSFRNFDAGKEPCDVLQDIGGYTRRLNWTPGQTNDRAVEFGTGVGASEEARTKSRDLQYSIELLIRAAKCGNAYAQYNLAQRIFYGEGIQKDTEDALYWTKRSISNGYEGATKFLEQIEESLRAAKR